MSVFLFRLLQAALTLNDLKTAGAFTDLHADIDTLMAKVRALATTDGGTPPTDEELRQMIADARVGFQAALDDE